MADVEAELASIHTYEALMDWYAEFCREHFGVGMMSWSDWIEQVVTTPSWKLRLFAHEALPPLPSWDWAVADQCFALFLVKHAEVKGTYGVDVSR